MRIAIIGHFGGEGVWNEGQTLKVRSLYNALRRNLDESTAIDKIDTWYLKHNLFKLTFDFVKALFLDKKIIFLPAMRGRKVLFPLMYIAAVIFKKDVYHDCIGGKQVYEVKEHPKWIKYMNSYKFNWMESEYLADKLAELGVKNAEYLPNFKHISPVSSDELRIDRYAEKFKFCTFCRVSETKGIGDAIEAIKKVNSMYGKEIAFLDIYGPVQTGEEKWFEDQRKNFSSSCRYCGVVDAEKSVEVLKDYYMMLFPSRCNTEGMPGTIIDAMFAGLPIIARRWDSCDQMIKDGYNGIVYDFNRPDLLVEKINFAIKNADSVAQMKINCVKESLKYDENTVIVNILKKMRLREK